MPRGTKTTIIGLIGATLISGSALAGGFSRGTADTDILFEEGGFNLRAGVLYVAPQRGYETIAGAPATDGNYTDSYIIPSVAAKFDLTEDLRCAGTYTQPFGADVTYGDQAILAGITAASADGATPPSGTAYSRFITNEKGLSCGYKFQMGRGNVWVMAGGFLESIVYDEGSILATPSLVPASLYLTENDVPGYRLGLAYEIPEIALRVQGIYRSEVSHNLTGTFYVNGGVANANAFGSATMPQSFELKAQSGIAPGWLAFGSVKWTDWSVLQTLDYFTTSAQSKDFFFKDGWTFSGGVGHRFNDMVSGTVSLTWDKGVSTTEDVNKDTYTLAGGLAVKSNETAELRIGGAVSYLQGGSVQQAANCNGGGGGGGDCGEGVGAKFGYTVGNDWSYALGASYNLKF